MWPKVYKDYPCDGPLKHQQIFSGKGIMGCEMHEINGLGNSWHGHLPLSIRNVSQEPQSETSRVEAYKREHHA